MEKTPNGMEEKDTSNTILESDIGKTNSLFETIFSDIKKDYIKYVKQVKLEEEQRKKMEYAKKQVDSIAGKNTKKGKIYKLSNSKLF